MRNYAIRRFLLIIPTLLIVTVIVFLMIRFTPGSALEIMAADIMADSPEPLENIIADLRAELGLDGPIYTQYGRWLGIWPQSDGGFSGLLQGDLGRSLYTQRDVLDEILKRIPISVELGLIAIITAVSIALPIGIYSAIRQDTIGDYVARSFAIMLLAIPGFWVGTLIFVLPSIWWNWTPAVQYIPFTENPGANLIQFLIPGVIMSTHMSGGTMRMTRTMMLEVLRQDYVRTAWAKGLKERTVIIRHALKNALIPVVTMIGYQIPILLGGSVIMETIFVLPGIGRYMVEAISVRDYPIISGINVMMASFTLVVILLVDLSYGWFDPRIRYR